MLARPTSIDGEEIRLQDRRDDAFLRAERHSRRVRLLKWALPALGVAMAVAFAAQSWWASPESIGVVADNSIVSDGKLVMSNPKLEGFTKDNLPYAMAAKRAVQDIANENVILLEEIGARLPINPGNFATIDALRGTFDRTANTLDLTSPVTITTTDGMVAKLNSAYLSMGDGNMTTTDPVDIRLNGAAITADGMSVKDNGKVLIFEKRVRVHIEPGDGQAAQAQPK